MEEQITYTYEKETKKPVNKARIFLAVVAVCVCAAALIAGIRLGQAKAERESAAASEEASRIAAEATTAAPEKYPAGKYVIQTDGYTLLLREQPSRDSVDQAEIPDKTEIIITEVREDPTAEDDHYQYWGKTEFEGQTGWVPMYYLQQQG